MFCVIFGISVLFLQFLKVNSKIAIWLSWRESFIHFFWVKHKFLCLCRSYCEMLYVYIYTHTLLEKEMVTHSSILAWRVLLMEEPGGLLSIGLHRVKHNWSDLACMHALEKEMAAHASVLTCRIPGMEEPGGLFMGLHRVGQDWSDLAAAAAAASYNIYLHFMKHSLRHAEIILIEKG